jgi:putative ABC transport system permease protein
VALERHGPRADQEVPDLLGAVRGGLAIATANGVAKVPALAFPRVGIPLCVAVSVLLAVVSAIPAAIAAAHVPPVAALNSSAVRDTEDRIGVLLLLAAGSVATAVFLGVVAYVRVSRRSAACVAVVALGTTMVCAVLVVLASLEEGSHDEVHGRAPSDAVIACWSSDEKATISPAVLDAVRAVPQVGAVVPVRRAHATAGASSMRVSVGSLDLTAHARFPIPTAAGHPAGSRCPTARPKHSPRTWATGSR